MSTLSTHILDISTGKPAAGEGAFGQLILER